MAGDWIKMRGNLWDDPRVSRLCDLTDQSEAAIVGGLYWLWATADQHTENGIMPGLTLRQIDRKTGVQGLAAALVEVGWLEDNPEGVCILNFEEHNGASAKRRSLDAQRKASIRNLSAPEADKRQTESGQITAVCGAREEKRREELIPEPKGSLSAAKLPDCPHQRILELWGKKLPQLQQPRTWEGARRTAMKCRWVQAAKPSVYSPDGYATEEAGLKWWESFFDYIAGSKLSAGFQSEGRHWQPDLEWVVNATNFQKIIDGKYDK